jgi:predicted RNase H-like nuclease (RuvC/YqgF family)
MTDFEKLLFTESYIKFLKSKIASIETENGKLQSEVFELQYLLKQEKPENHKLYRYKQMIKSLRLKVKKYKRKYEDINNSLIKSIAKT